MMRIGVVADTHSLKIPEQLVNDFKTVDLIIHAGDFCSLKDLNFFKKLNPLKAVFGNMDESDLCKQLPESEIFDCEGVNVGVYHGEGPAKKVLDFVKLKFAQTKADVVIFGHSHHPVNEIIDGVLYFNPGSPNDEIVAPYRSYGILEIKNKEVSGKIIKVK